jgi:hypothetical protein
MRWKGGLVGVEPTPILHHGNHPVLYQLSYRTYTEPNLNSARLSCLTMGRVIRFTRGWHLLVCTLLFIAVQHIPLASVNSSTRFLEFYLSFWALFTSTDQPALLSSLTRIRSSFVPSHCKPPTLLLDVGLEPTTQVYLCHVYFVTILLFMPQCHRLYFCQWGSNRFYTFFSGDCFLLNTPVK